MNQNYIKCSFSNSPLICIMFSCFRYASEMVPSWDFPRPKGKYGQSLKSLIVHYTDSMYRNNLFCATIFIFFAVWGFSGSEFAMTLLLTWISDICQGDFKLVISSHLPNSMMVGIDHHLSVAPACTATCKSVTGWKRYIWYLVKIFRKFK